ncbi:Lipase [Morella rubra]|uniref:Lipase n=1 Tax=Morella rubra TaxID=262757 RepID=A0A6A1VRZ0_9ROSI|nr:Lipase [Morella rubra]
MGWEKGAIRSYMLLKSKEASFSDVVRILFSNDIKIRKNFVDCPKDTRENFPPRWPIFVSLVAQKSLQIVSKPMAKVGTAIERRLNLLSGRDPDRTSPTFVSMVGLMDDRVELDSSIKYGDPRYNSVLSMMAAKISYENENYIKSTVEDHWKMEFLGSYNFWNDYQEKSSTQAFMLRDKATDHNIIVVAFKGTEPFDADSWLSDVDLSWYELYGVGRTHRGFMKALGLQKNVGFPKEIDQDDNHPPSAYYAIREMLKQLLAKDDRARYILTGHSLGGALAILFPAILALHGEKLLLERFEGVYTFGQPRVGDKEFAEYMEQNLIDYNIRYFRLVYSNDIVPRLPYDDKTLMFKHFGPCVFYNSFYEGEIVSEEPNRNYFSLQEAIPMWTNAVWELIRSFVIGKIEGPFYKESTLQKGFRVFGLVVPGISAHSTQDYVNATRLGSPDLFSQHRIRSDE